MLPLNRNHFLLCPFIRSATSSLLLYSTAEDIPKGLIIINVGAAFSSAAAAPLNKIKHRAGSVNNECFIVILTTYFKRVTAIPIAQSVGSARRRTGWE